MTTTSTQRVAALRQRRRDAGLIRFEAYLTQQQINQIRKLLKLEQK